jgi:hypothetical protein
VIELLLAFAGAAHAQDPALIRGDDLAAYRDLTTRRPHGEEAVQAWTELLVQWPTSPLAELAWAELRDAGALEAVAQAHPEVRAHLPQLERSWTLHQHALARRPVDVAMAELSGEGEPQPTARPRWLVSASASGGYQGRSAFLALGARAEYGWLGATARLGRGESLYAQLGGRVVVPLLLGLGRPPVPLGLFGEVGVDTGARVHTLVGARIVWGPHLGLEFSAGGSWKRQASGPVVASELVWTF